MSQDWHYLQSYRLYLVAEGGITPNRSGLEALPYLEPNGPSRRNLVAGPGLMTPQRYTSYLP